MGRQQQQSRQRPISCQFCRLRKLRCSRQFPCGNCTSRGVPCRAPPDPPMAAASAVPAPRGPVPGTGRRRRGSGKEVEGDVLSRLERLESLLTLRIREQEAGSAAAGTFAPPPPPPQKIVVPAPVPVALPSARVPEAHSALPPKVQGLAADALFLDRTYFSPWPLTINISDRIAFRTCPIRLIRQSSSYMFQNANVPSASLSIEPTKCIWLPERAEAHKIVDKYTSDITYIHHVTHTPSMRLLVDEVYDSLSNEPEPPLGPIILLLSICANVTYAWIDADNERALFSSTEEANNQGTFWIKAAMDVVDHGHRHCHASMECVQGLIILSFVISNIEGISAQSRYNITRAIAMCRELGLHRLDHDQHPAYLQLPRYSGVKLEMGRRLWWYLVGTDWMMPGFVGSHEGTFTIHPQHMRVNKPLNINDEDLRDDIEPVGKPINEPTDVSYFLQRIRFAELCRETTDRMPLAAVTPDISYDVVLSMEASLNRVISELPPFFHLTPSQLERLPATDYRRTPSFTIQCYIVNLFIQGQMCRLHLPFFARGTVDPCFTHSRRSALEAARRIVEIERRLEAESFAFANTRLKMCVVLKSVFSASIVLLLDVCLASEGTEVQAKRAELMTVWRILEEAKPQSGPAARLMEMLKQVMHKHKVSLPVLEPHGVANSGIPLTPTSAGSREVSFEATPSDPVSMEQDWSAENRMDIDAIDWDSLFWGLDATFI